MKYESFEISCAQVLIFRLTFKYSPKINKITFSNSDCCSSCQWVQLTKGALLLIFCIILKTVRNWRLKYSARGMEPSVEFATLNLFVFFILLIFWFLKLWYLPKQCFVFSFSQSSPLLVILSAWFSGTTSLQFTDKRIISQLSQFLTVTHRAPEHLDGLVQGLRIPQPGKHKR